VSIYDDCQRYSIVILVINIIFIKVYYSINIIFIKKKYYSRVLTIIVSARARRGERSCGWWDGGGGSHGAVHRL
jgi:hypothetical protein